MTNARINITLMTPDGSVAAAVASALQSNGHVLTAPTVRDLRELPVQLGRAPVPVVLVDLDPHPQQVLPQRERHDYDGYQEQQRPRRDG